MTAGAATLKPPVGKNDHCIGQPNAPIMLVEYGDYQCPHCARAHPRVTTLQQRFGDRLSFVFRNFPLAESHPEAFHAAEAAESVAAREGDDAFWKMHDLLFEHQQDDLDALDDAHLTRYAETAGASAEQVQEDLDDGVYGERVREDFMSGVRSGVNGTPTFFINGTRYDGDWADVEVFATAIEAASGEK
jgi:protein-disulfide isomerase